MPLSVPLPVPAVNAPRRALPASVAAALLVGTLAPAISARADTPAQAQKAIQAICDRAAASYERRDASGFLAMHSPDYVARNVAGRKETLPQEQTALVKSIARKGFYKTAHCLVSPVALQGNRVSVILHWSYITHKARSATAPAYTIVRAYDEQTTWRKAPQGWQEAASDMTRDVVEFKR